MALVAIWKQKKTSSQTLQHERRLGMFWIVQKSSETVSRFRNNQNTFWWAATSRLNHLIPLYHAYNSIQRTRYFHREDKVILLWIVFTYARLNQIPPELFFDQNYGKDIEWDELIYKNFSWFHPQKFWERMRKIWYVRIPQDLFDNFTVFSDIVLREAQWRPTSNHNVWIYIDWSSVQATQATTVMLRVIDSIMMLASDDGSTQSPPSV